MSRFPYIFAFYSFKGGVGRSMALLNVAYALAGRGRHVLMLDMDLEAPGLSEFLKQKEEIITTSKFDIVDLLSWAQSTARDLPSEQNQLAPSVVPKSTDYISSIHPAKIENLKPALGETGHLDVISARLDDNYFDRFSHLSLGSLGQEEIVGTGRVLRAWLKGLVVPVKVPDYYGLGETVNVPYDYILVDSRTGISEIGGLCIGPLSDRLIVLTSLNVQNIEGTKKVLDEVGINKRRDSTDEPWDEADVSSSSIVPPRLGPKPTLLVASPIPSGELHETRKRLDECRSRIGPFAAKISYHPQLSLEETIFVRDWPDEYLSGEYTKLADHLMAVVNDHGSQLPPIDPDDFKNGREFDLERALRAATHRPDDAVATLLLGVQTKASSDAAFRQKDRAFRMLAVNPRFDRGSILSDWGNLLANHANTKTGYEAIQLFVRAGEKYETALKIRPDNYRTFNNWGVALTHQAKQSSRPEADRLIARACDKFAAALKINPEAHDAISNWGVALTDRAKLKFGSEADQLFAQAFEKFAAAVEINPVGDKALNNWGLALTDQGKLKFGDEANQLFMCAGEKFGAALKITPDNHDALNNWGVALTDQAKRKFGLQADDLFAQAGEKYKAALKIKPDKDNALNNWGYTLVEQAKQKSGAEADHLFFEAQQKFEAAFTLGVEKHEVLNNWGLALAEQAKQKSGSDADKLFVQAREKFAFALKIDPGDHDTLNFLGNTLIEEAKKKSGSESHQLVLRAIEKFEAAIKIKPDKHEALNNWGLAVAEQARHKSGLEADQMFTEAREKFEAALKIQPKNHKVLNNLGLTLADQARKQNGTAADRLFVQAGEKLAAALKINPDAHESLSNWGYTYLEQAKKKSGPEAARLYELGREKLLKSESIVPGSGAYNLVCLYALQGRDDECLHWLKLVRNQGNLDDIQKLLADSDLDSIRRKDWFRSFVAETLEKSER